MGQEIERKFLIKNNTWTKGLDTGTKIKQGYLNSNKNRIVRVRIYGDQGILTIKGKKENITRKEFEYNIPLEDAKKLLNLCEKPIIEKARFLLSDDDNTWEIDVFEGENKGLVIAEIELQNETQEFKKHEWLGKEVSSDLRYYNNSLISNPFTNW